MVFKLSSDLLIADGVDTFEVTFSENAKASIGIAKVDRDNNVVTLDYI